MLAYTLTLCYIKPSIHFLLLIQFRLHPVQVANLSQDYSILIREKCLSSLSKTRQRYQEALLCSASTSQTWAQFSKLMSKHRNLDIGLIMCFRWSLTPPTSDSHPLTLSRMSLVKAAEVHSQCLHKQSAVKVASCALLISTAMHHHHQHWAS